MAVVTITETLPKLPSPGELFVSHGRTWRVENVTSHRYKNDVGETVEYNSFTCKEVES